MFPIPESYPPPVVNPPKIKNIFFLNQDMLEKLRDALQIIEEVGMIFTLGIKVVVNPHVSEGKALWFDGSGKMRMIDLSGSLDEKE